MRFCNPESLAGSSCCSGCTGPASFIRDKRGLSEHVTAGTCLQFALSPEYFPEILFLEYFHRILQNTSLSPPPRVCLLLRRITQFSDTTDQNISSLRTYWNFTIQRNGKLHYFKFHNAFDLANVVARVLRQRHTLLGANIQK